MPPKRTKAQLKEQLKNVRISTQYALGKMINDVNNDGLLANIASGKNKLDFGISPSSAKKRIKLMKYGKPQQEFLLEQLLQAVRIATNNFKDLLDTPQYNAMNRDDEDETNIKNWESLVNEKLIEQTGVDVEYNYEYFVALKPKKQADGSYPKATSQGIELDQGKGVEFINKTIQEYVEKTKEEEREAEAARQLKTDKMFREIMMRNLGIEEVATEGGGAAEPKKELTEAQKAKKKADAKKKKQKAKNKKLKEKQGEPTGGGLPPQASGAAAADEFGNPIVDEEGASSEATGGGDTEQIRNDREIARSLLEKDIEEFESRTALEREELAIREKQKKSKTQKAIKAKAQKAERREIRRKEEKATSKAERRKVRKAQAAEELERQFEISAKEQKQKGAKSNWRKLKTKYQIKRERESTFTKQRRVENLVKEYMEGAAHYRTTDQAINALDLGRKGKDVEVDVEVEEETKTSQKKLSNFAKKELKEWVKGGKKGKKPTPTYVKSKGKVVMEDVVEKQTRLEKQTQRQVETDPSKMSREYNRGRYLENNRFKNLLTRLHRASGDDKDIIRRALRKITIGGEDSEGRFPFY